jgi:hypothetical protein
VRIIPFDSLINTYFFGIFLHFKGSGTVYDIGQNILDEW